MDKLDDTGKKRALSIIINNVVYDSLNHASSALSMNLSALRKAHKDLEKTSLSSIEREVRVTKTFIFSKKVRES